MKLKLVPNCPAGQAVAVQGLGIKESLQIFSSFVRLWGLVQLACSWYNSHRGLRIEEGGV